MTATNRPIPDWFSLDRYSWVKDLLETDPILLYQEFLFRVEALNDETKRPEIMAIIQQVEDGGRLTTKPLDVFALQPDTYNGQQEADLDLLETNPHPFLDGEPAARPMTTKDLAKLLHETDTRALPQISDCEAESQENPTYFPIQWRERTKGLLDRLSVDSHRYSRKAAHETDHSIHCVINLDCSDQAIMNALKRNLSDWRKNLDQAAGREHVEPRKTEKELGKIFTYRLIPYLDLKIWALSTGAHFTARELNATLYPDHDRGESSFLKTVDHNLKELLKPEGLNRLYSAAISANIAAINERLATEGASTDSEENS